MTGRDVAVRVGGALLIVGGASMGVAAARAPLGPLRDISEAASFIAAFTGFALACWGTLLLLRGARLRAQWLGACDPAKRNRDDTAMKSSDGASAQVDPFLSNAAFCGGGRVAIAAYLAMRAQQEQQHASARPNKSAQKRGAATRASTSDQS